MEQAGPVFVMPRSYYLRLGLSWWWCKLGETCEAVANISDMVETAYHPSPEQLVSDFAALTRPNKAPKNVVVLSDQEWKKKLFRYSINGKSFLADEVIDQE